MPAYLKILAYLAVSLAAGAAVAPAVFWTGQVCAAWGIADWLAGFPFHRVLSRCLQVSLVLFLWPAVRWIGLRRVSALGLCPNPIAARDAMAGFVVGVAGVSVVAAVLFASGFYSWRAEPDLVAVGRIVLTAGAVSLIEEVVFRGVVLGVCLWSLRPGAAIIVSSLLFAAVHFLKPAKMTIPADDVGWSSGFAGLLSFVGALPPPVILALGFASLLLAGCLLGFATVRTRSLWLAIGLHAGWVLGMQTSNLFFQLSSGETNAFLPWVGPRLVSGAVPTGLLPLAGLLLAGWLVLLYLRNAYRPPVA
jgi:membrane protease YdiL (CAAX protease family)